MIPNERLTSQVKSPTPSRIQPGDDAGAFRRNVMLPGAVDAAGAVVGAVEMSVFDRQQYEYRYLESHHRNPKHPHCTPMWALRH